LPQQFDIVENLNPIGRSRYPYLVVLQHDRVSSIGTVVVAPLTESSLALAGTRLHPVIEVGGRSYVVLTEELAAIRSGMLGRVVASAETGRYAIVAALDLLLTGI
jgi:mRNA-degrading endonuclease toxin of MazEF toxin-antitoxin module